MGRREEQETEARPIPILITSKIASDGDFEISNVRPYAVQGNKEVTELQPGQNFEIHCEYQIRNSAAGATYWSTCMTVWEVTDNKKVGADEYGNHLGSGWKDAHDAVNVSGIQEAKQYRVGIFANQAANAGQPPTSEW